MDSEDSIDQQMQQLQDEENSEIEAEQQQQNDNSLENEQDEEEEQKPQQKQNKNVQREQDSKKGRLIVRNLVYDINQKHLRKMFQKFGKISDISLPLNPSTGRARGFAFVQFDNKNMALKAIKELNGSKFKGREIVLDMAMQQDQFKKQNQSNQQQQKQDEQPAKKQEQQQQNKKNELEDDRESDFEIEKENEDEEEEDEESDIGNDSEEEDNDKKDQEKDQQKQKNQENEDLSNTIFIRNVSFNTTQKQFEEFFKGFGKIFFAKLVINRETGENRGTGFVKFKDAEIAQKLIKTTESFGTLEEAEDPLDLELDGRRLICLQGLQRGQAAEKTSQFEKDNKNKLDMGKAKNIDQLASIDRQNKRFIRLAKYGTFDVGLGKNEQEKQRRTAHLKDKLQKLKNPNNIVSQTRVAFKHLPKKGFDEQNLKEMVYKFLEPFLSEKEIKKQKIIKQAMILRDSEKKNQSRGIGFIELSGQKYAEQFLKELSNKIQQFRQFCQNTLPIAEFAIEDIRKIKKYQKIRENFQQQQKEELENRTPDEKKKERQVKKDKKQENQQQELSSKIRLNELLEDNKNISESTYKQAIQHLHNIKKRGQKQRLKKRINNIFKDFANEEDFNNNSHQKVNENTLKRKLKKEKQKLQKQVEQVNEKQNAELEELKQQQKQEKEKYLLEKKKNSVLQKQRKQKEREVINDIKKQVDKKRKAKKKADEEDDLDQAVKKHLQKLQKKSKWFNN